MWLWQSVDEGLRGLSNGLRVPLAAGSALLVDALKLDSFSVASGGEAVDNAAPSTQRSGAR
ncbi:hypothetical protein OG764_00365 [Streptomyces sp. NBC_00239]